jgi:hypothetical protein
MNPGRKPGNQVNKKLYPEISKHCTYPPNEIKKKYRRYPFNKNSPFPKFSYQQVHTVTPTDMVLKRGTVPFEYVGLALEYSRIGTVWGTKQKK